jgi:hypothetical protein
MQGVVIQGSTGYLNEVIDLYIDIPNVVFSTWENESEENIQLIKSKGIEVIQTPKPLVSGTFNINLQALSTFAGIQYLKNKGVTEILKIRNDLKPNNVKLLLDVLKGKSLSFLAICKPNVRPMYYDLVYIHNSFDFPVDLFIYGTTKNLEKCFDFQVEEELNVPPEALIAYNYFVNSNLDFRLDYDTFIKNGISFFMNECLENNIKVEWLKKGYELVKWHSDTKNYNY